MGSSNVCFHERRIEMCYHTWSIIFYTSPIHNKCSKYPPPKSMHTKHSSSCTDSMFQRFWGGVKWFDSHKKWVGAMFLPVQLELNTITFLSVFTKILSWPIVRATRPALRNHLSWQVLQRTLCIVQLKYAAAPSFINHVLPVQHIFSSSYERQFQRKSTDIECKALRHNLWTSNTLTHHTRPHTYHELLLWVARILLHGLSPGHWC
jgi:hypothetical protein